MTNLPEQILDEQRRNSDKAYQLLLESLPDSVFVLDRRGRIVLTNAAGERFARTPREKLLATRFADLFSGAGETVLFRAFQRVMRTRRPETTYGEFVFEDGRKGWSEVRVHSIPNGVLAVFRDIAQDARSGIVPGPGRGAELDRLALDRDPDLQTALQKRAREEKAQRAACEERLNLILETVFQVEGMDCGGIYLFDEVTGALLLVSHRGLSDEFVERVSFYGPEAPEVRLVSRGDPIYTHFTLLETLPEDVRRVETLRALAIIPIFCAGKVIGSLHVASHTIDEIPHASRSVLESIAVQVGDTVARLRAEEALRESEKRYRDLYEGMRDGCAAVDLSGRVIECNSAFLEMVGYNQEELFHLTYQDLTPAKWHPREARIIAEQVLAKGYSRVYEKEYIRKNRTVFPVELRTSLMRYETGAPKGMWAIVRDITERKRAEERVRTLSHELLRVQEKERQRISRDLHDQLAQDLAGLKLGLQSLLTGQIALPEAAVPKVHLLLERLQGCIQYVRELSYALHPSGLEHFGLTQTVLAYCEDFESKTGLQVDFQCPGIGEMDLAPEVGINLFRVIQEALHNVEKHARAKKVKIRLGVSRSEILLRLDDDGEGFDVRRREMSAVSEKRMGLRSMRERVALMGGRIRIGSRRGKGASIHVRVPLPLEKPTGDEPART